MGHFFFLGSKIPADAWKRAAVFPFLPQADQWQTKETIHLLKIIILSFWKDRREEKSLRATKVTNGGAAKQLLSSKYFLPNSF